MKILNIQEKFYYPTIDDVVIGIITMKTFEFINQIFEVDMKVF